MTNQEASKIIKDGLEDMSLDFTDEEQYEALTMAIKALEQNESAEEWYKLFVEKLEQEQSGDLISRQAVLDAFWKLDIELRPNAIDAILNMVNGMPSVKQERIGHCKDCKYFEYDSVAKVDGVPLIVAHEICSKWGDGCKTKEDGYCFLYEPQEERDKE